eukprot:TRINITY_DN1751_c0_g1_i1.p1 TRINITY_DN1751_c0_g1~~TRINITY_DN1751_c0_g1_i1.p1  ORF type:complete len:746 (-),score=201.33 TRINITY_DN1751_c0_g1_i1:146-2383(-)
MATEYRSDLVEVVQTASVLSRKGFEIMFTLPAEDVIPFFPLAMNDGGDEIIVKAYLIYAQAVNPHFPLPADPRPLFITHNSSGGAAVAGDAQCTLRKIPLKAGDAFLARFPKILLKINSPDIELRFLFVAQSKNIPSNTRIFGCSSPFVIIKDERTAKKVRETRSKKHRAEPYPQRVPKRAGSSSGDSPPIDGGFGYLDSISYGASDTPSEASSSSAASPSPNPNVPEAFSMAQLPADLRFAEDAMFAKLLEEVTSSTKLKPVMQPVTAGDVERAVPDPFSYLISPFDVGEGEYAAPVPKGERGRGKVVLAPGQSYEPVGLGEDPVPDSVDHLVDRTRSSQMANTRDNNTLAREVVVNDMEAEEVAENDDDDDEALMSDGDESSASDYEDAVTSLVRPKRQTMVLQPGDRVGFGSLDLSPLDPSPVEEPASSAAAAGDDAFLSFAAAPGGLADLDSLPSQSVPRNTAAPPAGKAMSSRSRQSRAGAAPPAARGAPAPPPPAPAAAPLRPSLFAAAAGGGPPPAPMQQQQQQQQQQQHKELLQSVSQTKTTLDSNMEKVLERGEKLDDLNVQSESLDAQSAQFNKKAKKKKGGMVRGLTRKISNAAKGATKVVLRRKSSKADSSKDKDVSSKKEAKKEAKKEEVKPSASAKNVASSSLAPAAAAKPRSPIPFSATFRAAVEAQRAVSLSQAIAQLSVADAKEPSNDDTDNDDDDEEGDDAADAALVAKQAAEINEVLLRVSQVRLA